MSKVPLIPEIAFHDRAFRMETNNFACHMDQHFATDDGQLDDNRMGIFTCPRCSMRQPSPSNWCAACGELLIGANRTYEVAPMNPMHSSSGHDLSRIYHGPNVGPDLGTVPSHLNVGNQFINPDWATDQTNKLFMAPEQQLDFLQVKMDNLALKSETSTRNSAAAVSTATITHNDTGIMEGINRIPQQAHEASPRTAFSCPKVINGFPPNMFCFPPPPLPSYLHTNTPNGSEVNTLQTGRQRCVSGPVKSGQIHPFSVPPPPLPLPTNQYSPFCDAYGTSDNWQTSHSSFNLRQQQPQNIWFTGIPTFAPVNQTPSLMVGADSLPAMRGMASQNEVATHSNRPQTNQFGMPHQHNRQRQQHQQPPPLQRSQHGTSSVHTATRPARERVQQRTRSFSFGCHRSSSDDVTASSAPQNNWTSASLAWGSHNPSVLRNK